MTTTLSYFSTDVSAIYDYCKTATAYSVDSHYNTATCSVGKSVT